MAPTKEKPRLTVQGVAKKLKTCRGNMAAVARAFGVSRGAVWKLVSKTPTLKEVIRDAREAMKDTAESALYKAIREGEAWAVCFFLKCQAKDRGYVERTEVETSQKNKLVIDEESASDGDGGDHSQDSPAPPSANGVPAE